MANIKSSVTSVASSASNVTLLAPKKHRVAVQLYNESTQICYVKLGATASTSSYTYQMPTNTALTILPQSEVCYGGIIDAIWAAANGNMRITELYVENQ